MTPQTIHSEHRDIHGSKIPNESDSGVRENNLAEEEVKDRSAEENDDSDDGESHKTAKVGDLVGGNKIDTLDFVGHDNVCYNKSNNKFNDNEGRRKIDISSKNYLEKNQTLFNINNDDGEYDERRDVVLSPISDVEIGVSDNIAFSEIVNIANHFRGEISANGELVDNIYKKKMKPEKEMNKNVGVIGGECDMKCIKNRDKKRKEEKKVVAKVTRKRSRGTCWGKDSSPLKARGSPGCIIGSSSSSSAAASSSASSPSSSSLSTFFFLLKKTVGMAVMLSVFSAITNVPVICAESNSAFDKDIDPVFLEPVPNVTVAVGRDASLTCAVDHLGLHKVAWIHLDRQMIVSIHNHVITRQPRFTVTHDSHKTWTLQVTKVTEADRGHYMCQVNTKPMISQTGFLQVVVPPNIVDKVSSKSNIVVREKDNVTLVCRGEGFPLPQIKWRREDSQPIETSDGRKVRQLDGPNLVLRQVSRTHMGAYLCIATNGVPPSVSKRITLDVEFAPQMHVPNQLVGSPLGTEVHLECFVEAHPRAITYWEFLDSMVMNSSRVTTRTVEDRYKIHMTLTIRDLQDNDFGMYKCISKNSIAETDGSITLNKTLRPTSPPQTMLHGYDDEDNPYNRNRGRQGRKEQHRKQLEETRRRTLEEEEKRREVEEARRRAKEMERQRLEHDFDRGQRNEQATRVTHTQSGSRSLVFSNVPLLSRCLLALYILSWIIHI